MHYCNVIDKLNLLTFHASHAMHKTLILLEWLSVKSKYLTLF